MNELPKNFTLPDKLDLDWNLIKDCDNFSSKCNSNETWYHGHEINVAASAYKCWVREYNNLKDGEIYKSSRGTDLSKTTLFFYALRCETKARMILNGVDPKEAAAKAGQVRDMMFFKGQFGNVSQAVLLLRSSQATPFTSLRDIPFENKIVTFEHGVGTTTIRIDGISCDFKIPEMLSACDNTRLMLVNKEANIRVYAKFI